MEIPLAECLPECREGWLASAVTWRHEAHTEGIQQSRNSRCNFLVARRHQVETAGKEVFRGSIAAAAATIFLIPGCEQPTMMTMPWEVSMARDNSRSSSVPGLSETRAIRWIPGAICVVLSISLKLAAGQAVPNRITAGGVPS